MSDTTRVALARELRNLKAAREHYDTCGLCGDGKLCGVGESLLKRAPEPPQAQELVPTDADYAAAPPPPSGAAPCASCETLRQRGDAYAASCEDLIRAHNATLAECETLRQERDAFRDEANAIRRNMLRETKDLEQRVDRAESERDALRQERDKWPT